MKKNNIAIIVFFVCLLSIVIKIAYSPSYPSFNTTTLPEQNDYLLVGVEYYRDVDNATPADLGDVYFESINITGKKLFTINSTTGEINFTPQEADKGTYLVKLLICDDNNTAEGWPNECDKYFWNFTIINSSQNNPPTLILDNITILEDTQKSFNLSINVSDEDTDKEITWTYYNYNSSLISLTIDNETNNLTITPLQNKYGNAIVNITAYDTMGKNATAKIIIQIQNVNDTPKIIYACNETINSTSSLMEDASVVCWINATDPDPNEYLKFEANYSWFLLNQSAIQTINYNASTLVNFTANDSTVGKWWVKVCVNDTSGLYDCINLNYTVINLNDAPYFVDIANLTVNASVLFHYDVNASDEDEATQYGETLYYFSNESWFKINKTTGMIIFTPSNENNGTNWINITVNDSSGASVSTIINFTILINYPPTLNVTPNFNITEENVFYYNLSINASDKDNNSIKFSSNDSWLNLSENGIITLLTNDSDVGVHWVNVTLTDSCGANSSYVLNFTVYNVEEAPNIVNIQLSQGSLPNVIILENQTLNISIIAIDEDQNIPDSTETISYYDNTTILDVDPITGFASFTPNFTQAFNSYSINFSVMDSTHLKDSEILTITVNNLAPELSIPDLIAIEHHLFRYDINSTNHPDYVLTYQTNSTLERFELNTSNGKISFLPNTSQIGTHWIEINVTDNYNSNASAVVNLTVYPNSRPTCNFGNSFYVGSTTIYETNHTGNFYVSGCNDTEVNGEHDNLTFIWYWNGTYNKSFELSYDEYISQYVIWNYSTYYLDEGVNNVTVVITDGYLNTSYSWYINVLHVNSPPVLVKKIGNFNGTNYYLEWLQDTTYTINLSEYFVDYDEYGLNYSNVTYNWTPTTNRISVSLSGNYLHLSPQEGWYGEENITITASDNITQTTSNLVILKVKQKYTERIVQTRTATSTRTVFKNVGFDIIIPGLITMIAGTDTIVPIIIKNTGDVDLNMLEISAKTNETGIQLVFDQNKFQKLKSGEEITANLRILAGDLAPERYVINIDAFSKSPSIRKSAKLFLDITEREAELKAAVSNELSFTRDIIQQNPECLELSELLDRAEKLINEGKFNEALNLIRTTNQACKDFLAKQKITGRIVEKPIKIFEWKIILGEIAIISIVFLGFMYYFKRRRFKKRFRI